METTERCTSELAAAGLATKEDCIEKGCGGAGDCCRRALRATPASEWSRQGLSFVCGKLELLDVVSITTKADETEADVKFRRRFTPDQTLLSRVTACTLRIPEPAEGEFTWTLRRNDEGKWSYKE